MRVFIQVSVRAFVSIYVCTMFHKKNTNADDKPVLQGPNLVYT